MSATITKTNRLVSPFWNAFSIALSPPSTYRGYTASQRRKTITDSFLTLTSAITGRRAVVAALQLPPPQEMPDIILSVSPCRSGTTAMLRVMAAMGVESHFQPLKNVLRWRLVGEIRPWRLDGGNQRTVYLKETLGPYTFAEATFNPLQLLLEAGVPPARLHLFVYGRHPLTTWSSWQKWWQGQTTLDYLIAAYQTTEKIRQQAVAANIKTTTLVYERFGQHAPTAVVKQLARRFQLPFTSQAAGQWLALPPFGSPASNVILPQEPARFITPGIHDSVHQAASLVFRTRSTDTIDAYDQVRMGRAGLFALYDQWEAQCTADLHLS